MSGENGNKIINLEERGGEERRDDEPNSEEGNAEVIFHPARIEEEIYNIFKEPSYPRLFHKENVEVDYDNRGKKYFKN